MKETLLPLKVLEFKEACAAPFVEYLQNEKNIYYKVTKEKDQMILWLTVVSFCNARG